ncbi:hypothetical protein [Marinobacter lipolyticus]|uniref:hypothetical protein n=1 Tax=Marinobacter lipolyticus TaxID=209639 RepID=UPI003301C544
MQMRDDVFLSQAQFTTSKGILTVTVLSLMILFRGAWAFDQNVHEASQSLSLAEFAENHGHFHTSSLDHLHVYTAEMTDWDHLLLHALSAFDNHVPLDLAVVRSPSGQDQPELQNTPSPLPEQAFSVYRPPKA